MDIWKSELDHSKIVYADSLKVAGEKLELAEKSHKENLDAIKESHKQNLDIKENLNAILALQAALVTLIIALPKINDYFFENKKS